MKTRIASLSLAISTANRNEIQLLPAGYFRASDGRPEECPSGWYIDADIAATLIAAADARATPYVLDYEHQTLRAAKNGKPAPASGWFKQLEWREGEGLFATGVDWTDAAAAHIEAKEYRFISPVFLYDNDGRVTELLNAALTNTPALDDMDEVMLAAASLLAVTSDEDFPMDELLEQLRWFLNLPTAATADDILAELQKLVNNIKSQSGSVAAASGIDFITRLQQQVAALATQVDSPDPARWVSVDVMNQAIDQARASSDEQIAQLTLQQNQQLIEAALSDGRLLPAQKSWAESLAKSSPEQLHQHLAKRTAIAALSRTQTGGQQPSGVRTAATEPEEDINPAVLSLMGIDISMIKKGDQ